MRRIRNWDGLLICILFVCLPSVQSLRPADGPTDDRHALVTEESVFMAFF